MRHTLRERPRVAAAKAVGVLALIGGGVALGAFIAGNSPRIPQTTEARLVAAEGAVSRQVELLSTIRSKLSRTQLKLDQTRAALDAQSRRARTARRRASGRLRRDLREAKLALRRQRREVTPALDFEQRR